MNLQANYALRIKITALYQYFYTSKVNCFTEFSLILVCCEEVQDFLLMIECSIYPYEVLKKVSWLFLDIVKHRLSLQNFLLENMLLK